MKTANRFSRRDELLAKAEELAKEMPAGAKNEVRRALHYFVRHPDYDELMALLRLPLPWYGRQARDRWQGVRDVLSSRRAIFKNYTPEEFAFLLGWVSRLLS